MAMSLSDAFNAIRGSNALSKEFVASPLQTLSSLGVDTSNLKVTPNSNSNTIARASAANASACVSIGCGVCASVG